MPEVISVNGHTCPEAAQQAVIALGNFDGIHLGHQAVIGAAVERAKQAEKPSAILTFEPHPMSVFTSKEAAEFRLSDTKSKAALLAPLGVDYLFEVPFNEALFTRTAAEFVSDILVSRFNIHSAVCGSDFVFGYKRSGDATTLATLGKKYGFGFESITPIGQQSEIFSSSLIRAALKSGNIAKATAILGHYHLLHGSVAHGDKRGRTIGFPTANIELKDFMPPAIGVYAGLVRIQDQQKRYPAVMNLGLRPTFSKKNLLLEVHLLDNHEHSLYDKELWIELVDYLRPEQKFDGIDALKKQIAVDATHAKNILAELTK